MPDALPACGKDVAGSGKSGVSSGKHGVGSGKSAVGSRKTAVDGGLGSGHLNLGSRSGGGGLTSLSRKRSKGRESVGCVRRGDLGSGSLALRGRGVDQGGADSLGRRPGKSRLLHYRLLGSGLLGRRSS
jgi:hypothetical protein